MSVRFLHPVPFVPLAGLSAKNREFMVWAMCSILENNFWYCYRWTIITAHLADDFSYNISRPQYETRVTWSWIKKTGFRQLYQFRKNTFAYKEPDTPFLKGEYRNLFFTFCPIYTMEWMSWLQSLTPVNVPDARPAWMSAPRRQLPLRTKKQKSTRKCALTARPVSMSVRLKRLRWSERFGSSSKQGKVYRMRNLREWVSGICNINRQWKSKSRQGYVRRMRNLCWRLPVRSYSHGIGPYLFIRSGLSFFRYFQGRVQPPVCR